MDEDLKPKGFDKLSYPVQQITMELITLKEIYEKRKKITNLVNFITIILGVIYYLNTSYDYFNMLLVPLSVLLVITLFNILFNTYEDKYNALLKALKEYLKKDFYHSPIKCNCQHEYIKSMKEDFKIKLY